MIWVISLQRPMSVQSATLGPWVHRKWDANVNLEAQHPT